MVSKRLQRKWEKEAEKYGKDGEIFKIFSNMYSPVTIEPFYPITAEEVQSVFGNRTNRTKTLGLFTEIWRLAIKKSFPPCCEYDFKNLLCEARITWAKKGYKGAYLKTLRKLW